MPPYTVIVPRLVNIRAHVVVDATSPTDAARRALERLEALVDPGPWLTEGFPHFDRVQADDLSWSYEAFELDPPDCWAVLASRALTCPTCGRDFEVPSAVGTSPPAEDTFVCQECLERQN